MEKVKRFFRNFNEKKSYRVVFFVVSMCVILGLSELVLELHTEM